MGLFSALLTLPLAPVRGTIWIAEQLLEEAERDLHDPALIEDQLLEQIQAVAHDRDQQGFLGLDMVIEASLGETTVVGDVLDGGSLVAALADQTGGVLEDGPVSSLGGFVSGTRVHVTSRSVLPTVR